VCGGRACFSAVGRREGRFGKIEVTNAKVSAPPAATTSWHSGREEKLMY